MGLQDVAGVFSRYFIIGFFLPAFFVLLAVSQVLTSSFLPALYTAHGDGTRILIIGGAAVLLGLLLMGLNYPVFRFFEGYSLTWMRERKYLGLAYRTICAPHARRLARLEAVLSSPESSETDKGLAAWSLDRFLPTTADQVLPSRFGNAVLAFESHSMRRWGLDAIPAWPRIQLILSDDERQIQADARSEAAFFINASLLLAAAGPVIDLNFAIDRHLALTLSWLYLAPFALSYLVYRWSIGAAVRWGSVVRSAIDLNRLDLYRKLGVRAPKNFTDERTVVAPAVSGTLIYGYELEDALWGADADATTPETEERDDG